MVAECPSESDVEYTKKEVAVLVAEDGVELADCGGCEHHPDTLVVPSGTCDEWAFSREVFAAAVQAHTRTFGCGAGTIKIAPDFDELCEGFDGNETSGATGGGGAT